MTTTRGAPVAGYFPTTRLTILERLRGDPVVRQQAFDVLAGAYWKPIYKYVRYRHQLAPADAEGATQSFLAAAFGRRLYPVVFIKPDVVVGQDDLVGKGKAPG